MILNIDKIKEELKENTVVFAGPSGVGKSSLLNEIDENFELKTGEVSDKIKRGKHTTRHAELLKLECGGMVADTPGFSSLTLDDIEESELKEYFIEFDNYDECRFGSRCIHENEPSCSVKEAVENNYIHIHDKDYYLTKSFTCLQHPLDRIFESGFRIGHGEARAPKRIETAAMLAVISLESIQNEMHGGQAIPAFDFYMAPYVRATFIEEVKKLEDFTKKDYKHLYNAVIADFVEMSTKDYVGENEHIIRIPGIPIGIYDYRLTGIYPLRAINKIKKAAY